MVSTIAGTPSQSPDYGSRSIPSLIDERAESGYARPAYCIPTSPNVFQDISYWQFANAVNRCSRWLLQYAGHSQVFETIVYLGPGDLRYQLFLLAAVKTGHVLFVPSPRNSYEAFQSLIEECDASIFLTTSNEPPGASVIVQARPELRKLIVPELDVLLDTASVNPVPFNKTFEDCRYEPFVRVHTSGSTGLPKLVTLPHGTFAAIDATQLRPGKELSNRLGNMRVFCAFPSFHTGGIGYTLAILLYVDSTVILPPSGPLNAEIVNTIHTQATAQYSLLPPSILMDLAKNQEYLENLGKLRGVSFAGGPLPKSVGQQIVSRTRLLSGYGATEFIGLPQFAKDHQDWIYFNFDVEGGGIKFEQRDEGQYELVLVRRQALDRMQSIFVTFPDLQEYHTKDLFERHPDPEKSSLWKYKSRLDDIIVFSNGEKLNPVTMESVITASPALKGCLVVGQGYFQAALLIEPTQAPISEVDLIEQVWPYVQRANSSAVKHGHVIRELIIRTSPEKPLARAGKGTIQRASSVRLYEAEISRAYQDLEQCTKSSVVSEFIFVADDMEATARSLSIYLQGVLNHDPFSDKADFFALGLDSLQLITLVRTINLALPGRKIDMRRVYENPSVEKLARALYTATAVDGPPAFPNPYDSDDEQVRADWLRMEEMYQAMTENKRTLRRGLRSTDNGPVIPPDHGTSAWLQVFASWLININNWGLVNAFGAFQAFYETRLLSTWSPTDISWIGTLQGALILLVGVVSGPLFDTGYFRVIVIGASACLVLALMLLSLCTTYWQVMLAHTLIGLCSGMLYIPSVALIPVYFKHRRGLALGLATSGGSIGGIIYPIMFDQLIDRLSFGWTVRIIGFVALVSLGTAAAVLRPLGARTRRHLFHIQALLDPPYASFLLSACVIFAALLVPFFLSTTYASDELSINVRTAVYFLPILNACQAVGRIGVAYWADFHHRWMGSEALLFLAEVAAGVLGFSWAGVHSTGGYIAWVICYGLVSGAVITLPALVLQFVSPNMAVYGTRLGMLYACAGLGFLMSTPVATSLDSITQSYLGAQMWTGACCVAAAACFSFTGLRARERRLLYESGKPTRRLRWNKQLAVGKPRHGTSSAKK